MKVQENHNPIEGNDKFSTEESKKEEHEEAEQVHYSNTNVTQYQSNKSGKSWFRNFK
jgi:hypothetical protein